MQYNTVVLCNGKGAFVLLMLFSRRGGGFCLYHSKFGWGFCPGVFPTGASVRGLMSGGLMSDTPFLPPSATRAGEVEVHYRWFYFRTRAALGVEKAARHLLRTAVRRLMYSFFCAAYFHEPSEVKRLMAERATYRVG